MKTIEQDIQARYLKVFQNFKSNGDLRFGNINLPYHQFNLAGSTKEGCFSARLFQNDGDFDEEIHRGVELDFEAVFFQLPSQHGFCIEEIKNKKGFFRYRMNENCITKYMLDTMKNKLHLSENVNEFITETGHLNSYMIKRTYINAMKFHKSHKIVHMLRLISGFCSGTSVRNIRISKVNSEVSKAVTTFSMLVEVNNILKLKISSDFAFVFEINTKPNILDEYLSRPKKWPDMKDLEKECHKSFFIAKPSNEERKNSHATEIRHSFAHIERKLVLLQSETQRLVYLIFKSIFYMWVKPIDPDHISSFIAKTVMLWTCEQHPPSHRIWARDSASIRNALKHMFGKLYQAFREGHLSYLFIPRINILQSIPVEKKVLATNTLKQIYDNIGFYIPNNTNRINEYLKEWLERLKLFQDVVEEIKTSGYSQTLLHHVIAHKDFSFLKQLQQNGVQLLESLESSNS